jgi:hypothetical protein
VVGLLKGFLPLLERRHRCHLASRSSFETDCTICHEEAAMTARYRRPYPRTGQGTPPHEQLHQLYRHAQTLATDLED